MTSRRFVVTVCDAPARVVVEDVRSRRRAVADDLAAVGGQIARLSNPLDAAIADEEAVGTIVDTSGGGGGGASPPFVIPPFTIPPDTTVDSAKLKAKKTQKQKGKKITVKLTVGAAENVTVLAKGKVKLKDKSYKLKQATKTVAAGKTKTLKLTLKKSSHAGKLVRALRRGKKVTARLSVKFTDELANSASAKAVVKLK